MRETVASPIAMSEGIALQGDLKMIDNIQLAIWLEYAENSIARAATKAKNPAVARVLKNELTELTTYINDLRTKPLTPTPIEAEIKKKGG